MAILYKEKRKAGEAGAWLGKLMCERLARRLPLALAHANK